MTMSEYLSATEFATRSIFDSIYKDIDKIKAEGDRLAETGKKFAEKKSRMTPAWAEEPVIKDVFETHESDKKKNQKAHKTLIEARDDSIASLCGALLQIARQGISIHEKTLPRRIERSIGKNKLSLACIIWNARNQAMHWETHDEIKKKPNDENLYLAAMKLEKFFGKLDVERNEFPSLSLQIGKKSLAKVVVMDVIKWKSYKCYETDMKKL